MVWAMWTTPSKNTDIWLVNDETLELILEEIHTRYHDLILFEAELVTE